MSPVEKPLRIGEAATYLGMSVGGVRFACEQGRIHHTVTASGQRVFVQSDLDAFLGRPAAPAPALPRTEALYCRVSGTVGQETSLEGQEDQLRASSRGEVFKVYRDRASGLRETRPGLTRLLADAREGKFTVVRVTHADRLSRFGVSYLQALIERDGVALEVLSDRREASPEEELMQDFMSLLASFSGRFYRVRSRERQHQLLREVTQRLENGGDTAGASDDG